MGQIKRYRKKRIESKKRANQLKSAVLKLGLIMLNFMFATFAWFTYTKILNPAVDVNISAWQIDFKDGEGIIESSMTFEVGNFYPDMEDYIKEIEMLNLGDRAASIEYKIDTLTILGEDYTIKTVAEEGDDEENKKIVYKSVETIYKLDENGNTLTDVDGNPVKDKYVERLLNNSTVYPFEIVITYPAQISRATETDNKGNFEICFTWPYEITEIPASRQEELEGLEGEELAQKQEEILEELNATKINLDTQWGYNIAEYYKVYGNTAKGIEISLEIIAKQII